MTTHTGGEAASASGEPVGGAAGARHPEEPWVERPRRWPLVLVGAVALATLGWFAADAFREAVAPHHTPAEVVAAAPGGSFRLAGTVGEGTLERDPGSGVLRFDLEDEVARIPVRLDGRAPDSLTEGAEAVADGRLAADGTFVADRVLTQCASRFEEEPEP